MCLWVSSSPCWAGLLSISCEFQRANGQNHILSGLWGNGFLMDWPGRQIISAVGSQRLLRYLACDRCSNVLVEIVFFFWLDKKIYIHIRVCEAEWICEENVNFFNSQTTEQHIGSKITTMAEWQPVKNIHLGHTRGNSLTAPTQSCVAATPN